MNLYKKYNKNTTFYSNTLLWPFNKFIRSFSSNFKPIILYVNSLINKSIILKDNRGKSGIYRWVNKINKKSYIGSSANLYYRLTNYYSINYLNKRLLITNSNIYRAILLYGHNNFDLEILEYCNNESLIIREQHYIDLFKPEYNILKIAGSSLGFKHSSETLLKFKDRKLSAEALKNLRFSKKGIIPLSPLRKTNHLLATGHTITIVNKKDNYTKVYGSIRAAARDIGVNHSTIINYINKKKLLKGIYLIIKYDNKIV